MPNARKSSSTVKKMKINASAKALAEARKRRAGVQAEAPLIANAYAVAHTDAHTNAYSNAHTDTTFIASASGLRLCRFSN